jgi:hypothetical protein
MLRLPADNDAIFACVRSNDDNTVIAVMNMSGEEQTVNLDLGEYSGKYRCICGKKQKLEATQSFTLSPWEYRIYER